MPGDPFKVFAEGEPFRRESLKAIWPELYKVLMPPEGSRKPVGCPLTGHGTGDDRQFVPVVGRLHLNGTPACELHLRSSDRPGGYPLDLVDNPAQWRKEHPV